MVRLLRGCEYSFAVTSRRFNPTMVRLLRFALLSAKTIAESFNPTMVRLLRFAAKGGARTYRAFQSHNGAIAA